jgi:hypothetical protein
VDYPEMTNHGWLVKKRNGCEKLDWMDLLPAPDGILENVDCACRKGCSTNRCSCFKAGLQCTSMCKCQDCTNATKMKKVTVGAAASTVMEKVLGNLMGTDMKLCVLKRAKIS